MRKRKRYRAESVKRGEWCVIDYKENQHGMVCMSGDLCSLTKKQAMAAAALLARIAELEEP